MQKRLISSKMAAARAVSPRLALRCATFSRHPLAAWSAAWRGGVAVGGRGG